MPKKPVHVEGGSVLKVFDKKYKKAAIQKWMVDAAKKPIDKSSKLTSKATNKKAEGFVVLLALLDLKKTVKGKQTTVEANVKITGATWPAKSMFAFASGSAATTVPDPKKIDGDVKFAVEAAVGSLMKKKVVPALEARG